MKKNKTEYKVTHIFKDGKRISHEEFHSKPYAVDTELNREFLIECNRLLDPRWREKENRSP